MSLLTSRRPTGGKRDFGQAEGLRLSRFCWRSFLRRLGELWRFCLKNLGIGFGIKGVLRHLRTGGSGSTATKRRAGRVSLLTSRRRTKGKPGIRTWRRGYACLGSAGGISYGGLEKYGHFLSEKLRDRIRNQGREMGRKEGRVEGRAAGHAEASSHWRMWFERYEEARKKGEPFDDKQGFRIADDLTKRLFEPNGLGANLSSPTAPCRAVGA